MIDEAVIKIPKTVPYLIPERDPKPFTNKSNTLVFELKVMASTWGMSYHRFTGRHVKRPGLDYFLRYLSFQWEIICYTDEPWRGSYYAVESMDPTRSMVTYNLYQEQCKKIHERYVKQLAHLGRDLASLIMMDSDPNNCDHPENVLVMPYWDGKQIDTKLLDMIPLFQDISLQGATDMRPMIRRLNLNPELIDEYKLQRMVADENRKKFHDIPDNVVEALQIAFGRTDEEAAEDDKLLDDPELMFPRAARMEKQRLAQHSENYEGARNTTFDNNE